MNASLIEENNALKDRLAESERTLDAMKSIYVDGHQDESLRRSNPSLFEFLLEKKTQFLNFEQTIEKIESYIEERDEAITKLIAGFAEKNEKCVCGKETELANLQAEFDSAVKRSDQLQETVAKLRKEMNHYENSV
jgi:predicted  nucleic acid-binding Zn-ribbon protein